MRLVLCQLEDEDTLHFLIKCNALYAYRKESMKELKDIIRERPFNLKGGGGLWFFSKKNILIPNVAEKNILIMVEEKK